MAKKIMHILQTLKDSLGLGILLFISLFSSNEEKRKDIPDKYRKLISTSFSAAGIISLFVAGGIIDAQGASLSFIPFTVVAIALFLLAFYIGRDATETVK